MHIRARPCIWLLTLVLTHGTSPADTLRLRSGTIDTAPARRAYARSGRSQDKVEAALQQRRSHLAARHPLLLQLTGPASPKQWARLRALEVTVVGYIPDQAWLVRMNPARLDEVAALPFVQWVGEYEAKHKLPGDILALARRGNAQVNTQSLNRARSFTAPDA